MRQRFSALPAQVFAAVEGFAVQQALAAVMDSLSAANQYLEQTAPWKQAKNGDSQAVATSLYSAAEAVRLAPLLLSPVLPQRAAEVWRRLGWSARGRECRGLAMGRSQAGQSRADWDAALSGELRKAKVNPGHGDHPFCHLHRFTYNRKRARTLG